MPQTYETPGSGPVEELSIWRKLDAVDEFPVLKKNGFSIPQRNVRLQGKLADSFAGDLMMEHHAMEGVFAQERVKNVKGGRFDIKVNLMRGRNTFFLSSSEDPSTTFRLDVFYRSAVREWLESIIKAFVLVLIVKTFVVQAFFIPTQSMETTLLVGDYLLVDKITYLFRDPLPGEIVVFEFPQDPQKSFIKRCVAVGGDKIAHYDDTLYKNGKPLKEPYVQYDPKTAVYGQDRRNFGEMTITPGCFFMMGDNRNNSQDSRYWGELPRWRVIGKAWAGYWPLNRLGLMNHTFGKPAS
jgi:signal peptidase I